MATRVLGVDIFLIFPLGFLFVLGCEIWKNPSDSLSFREGTNTLVPNQPGFLGDRMIGFSHLFWWLPWPTQYLNALGASIDR